MKRQTVSYTAKLDQARARLLTQIGWYKSGAVDPVEDVITFLSEIHAIDKIDLGKDMMRTLCHQCEAGSITQEQYHQWRLPLSHLLGSRNFYNDKGEYI